MNKSKNIIQVFEHQTLKVDETSNFKISHFNALEKYGYKVLDEQIKLNGYFFIDDELKEFDLRPDLLVEKDGIQYIAEIKTGEVANPSNRNTRRQLHEYSYYSNQEIVLLVDPIRKSIKRLSFKKNLI